MECLGTPGFLDFVELGLLTGVAAILRFPLPDIDDEEDNENNWESSQLPPRFFSISPPVHSVIYLLLIYAYIII